MIGKRGIPEDEGYGTPESEAAHALSSLHRRLRQMNVARNVPKQWKSNCTALAEPALPRARFEIGGRQSDTFWDVAEI